MIDGWMEVLMGSLKQKQCNRLFLAMKTIIFSFKLIDNKPVEKECLLF